MKADDELSEIPRGCCSFLGGWDKTTAERVGTGHRRVYAEAESDVKTTNNQQTLTRLHRHRIQQNSPHRSNSPTPTNAAAVLTQARREEEKKKSFPGPRDVWGPPSVRNTEKGVLSDLKYA